MNTDAFIVNDLSLLRRRCNQLEHAIEAYEGGNWHCPCSSCGAYWADSLDEMRAKLADATERLAQAERERLTEMGVSA